MSRTHRFQPGHMPAGLVHAVVLELGLELHCEDPRHRHDHPDACASGQYRYWWMPRTGTVSDSAFATALRRRGWSEANIRAWRAPVSACCATRNGPRWERRAEGRAARRIAKVQVETGREDQIRRHPRYVCDGH